MKADFFTHRHDTQLIDAMSMARAARRAGRTAMSNVKCPMYGLSNVLDQITY